MCERERECVTVKQEERRSFIVFSQLCFAAYLLSLFLSLSPHAHPQAATRTRTHSSPTARAALLPNIIPSPSPSHPVPLLFPACFARLHGLRLHHQLSPLPPHFLSLTLFLSLSRSHSLSHFLDFSHYFYVSFPSLKLQKTHYEVFTSVINKSF